MKILARICWHAQIHRTEFCLGKCSNINNFTSLLEIVSTLYLSLIISLMSESGIPIPCSRRFLITSTSFWNKDLFPDNFLGPLVAAVALMYIFEDKILGKIYSRTSLPQKHFARPWDQPLWCKPHLASEVPHSETFVLLVTHTYKTFLLSQNVAFLGANHALQNYPQVTSW